MIFPKKIKYSIGFVVLFFLLKRIFLSITKPSEKTIRTSDPSKSSKSGLHPKSVSNKEKEEEKQTQSHSFEETIFVSIACYRDRECPTTLYSLFSNAKRPDRLFVGLCQQEEEDIDSDILEEYKLLCKKKNTKDYSEHVRVFKLPSKYAKGHIFARHIIERYLYNQEKYYLIIDSHTMFSPLWDIRVLEEWKSLVSLRHPKPILTYIPHDYDPAFRKESIRNMVKEPIQFTYWSSKTTKTSDQFPEIEARSCVVHPNQTIPSVAWCGRFSFSSSQLLREVPHDPYLLYITTGEDLYMSARVFTHGYSLFHPKKQYISHLHPDWASYDRWEQYDPEQHERYRWKSYKRMQYLFLFHWVCTTHQEESVRQKHLIQLSQDYHSIHKDLDRYGFGKTKTMEQFLDYTGVKLQVNTTNSTHPITFELDTHGMNGYTLQADADELMAKLGVNTPLLEIDHQHIFS